MGTLVDGDDAVAAAAAAFDFAQDGAVVFRGFPVAAAVAPVVVVAEVAPEVVEVGWLGFYLEVG